MSSNPNDVDYICEHNRLQCACCYDKLTPEQKAFQSGAVHQGYGWAPKPPGEHRPLEREAYLTGYHREHREAIAIGARVKTDHGTGVVRRYEVVGAVGIRETDVAPEHDSYRLMIELDPGHLWQKERPELLYCEWPEKVEVLDGNS